MFPSSPTSSLPNHPLLWRGADATNQARLPALATGYAALDRELPGGGWPAAGLSELLCDAVGAGEVSLLMPVHAAQQAGKGMIWIAPPHVPYAPALAAAGVDLKKLLIVRPTAPADAWWAAEQAMRSGAAAIVVLWADRTSGASIEYAMLRRLQLACSSAQCAGFVYRTSDAARQASPAPLRIALSAAAQGLLELRIIKRRSSSAAAPLRLQTLHFYSQQLYSRAHTQVAEPAAPSTQPHAA